MQPNQNDNHQTYSPIVQKALAKAQMFVTRILPRVTKRFASWRNLNGWQRLELQNEMQQELICDAIAHAARVCRLRSPARHLRWLRLISRWSYKLYVRPHREALTGKSFDTCEGLPLPTREFGVRAIDRVMEDAPPGFGHELMDGVEQMSNGRINMTATANSFSVSRRCLRNTWTHVAEQLGYDEEFLAFWRRRMGEAVLGLAADLVRQRRRLCLWAQPDWRVPDVHARMRRIRRIRSHLSVRPLPWDLGQIGRRLGRPNLRDAKAPLWLLECAAQLLPTSSSVPLWAFEAHAAAGDLRQAARSVRRAQTLGGAPVPAVLARARLLELRGRTTAAAALLLRAERRHRHDVRLLASRAQLLGEETAAVRG